MINAIKENRCCCGVLLIVMITFLSAFIFFTCAYFKTPKVSSNIEISPAQNVSNKISVCNNTSIERNRTSERICTSSGCVRAATYLIESMDLEVDPCEDFYEFTCGNWKNYHNTGYYFQNIFQYKNGLHCLMLIIGCM